MLKTNPKQKLVSAISEQRIFDVVFILDSDPKLLNRPLSKNGKAALHLALETGNHELVKTLLERKATSKKAKIVDRGIAIEKIKTAEDRINNGMTPIAMASYLDQVNIETLNLLIEHKADISLATVRGKTVETQTRSGDTPLMLAAFYGKQDRLKILIETRRDVSVNHIAKKPSVDFPTALMCAVEKCDAESVDLILGIPGLTLKNINYKNPCNGESALFMAARKGDKAKVELLLKIEGIDYLAIRHDGKNALQIASQQGHKEIARLIQQKLFESFTQTEVDEILREPLTQAIFEGAKDTFEAIEEEKGKEKKKEEEKKEETTSLTPHLPSFREYLRPQRRIPDLLDLACWLQYIRELKKVKDLKHTPSQSASEATDVWLTRLIKKEEPDLELTPTTLKQRKIHKLGYIDSADVEATKNGEETKSGVEIVDDKKSEIPEPKLRLEEVSRPSITITESMRSSIEARMLFSKMVSDTDRVNMESGDASISLVQRLKTLGYQDGERIYPQLIDFLKNHSVIVLGFNAEFLRKNEGLQYYQPRNGFEKETKPGWQTGKGLREKTEQGLFKDNEFKLKDAFLSNPQGRPIYAAWQLIDNSFGVQHVEQSFDLYGLSYLVLKGFVAFNSLFVDQDSCAVGQHGYHLKPATYHHLERLLVQFENDRLRLLVERVITGSLPFSYKVGDYMEAFIPRIEFSSDYIEHIHIAASECKLSPEEIKAISREKKEGGLGIPITNTSGNPYQSMRSQFRGHIDRNEVKEVEALLKTHPSLIRITNADGEGPLHIAAKNGHYDLVKLLIEQGAPVNELAKGKAPLHFALQSEHNSFETVQTLITSCLYKNDKGCIRKRFELNLNVEIYHPRGSFDRYTPLTLAVLPTSDIRSLNLLLEYGADVSHTPSNGDDALILTAWNNQLDRMKMLIKTGKADINKILSNGDTLLITAVNKADAAMIDYILAQSPTPAMVNQKNNQGESALFIAARLGKITEIERLLTFSEIDTLAKRIPDGKTAAQIAIDNEHYDIAVLLKEGQSIDFPKMIMALSNESIESIIKTLNELCYKYNPKIVAVWIRISGILDEAIQNWQPQDLQILLDYFKNWPSPEYGASFIRSSKYFDATQAHESKIEPDNFVVLAKLAAKYIPRVEYLNLAKDWYTNVIMYFGYVQPAEVLAELSAELFVLLILNSSKEEAVSSLMGCEEFKDFDAAMKILAHTRHGIGVLKQLFASYTDEQIAQKFSQNPFNFSARQISEYLNPILRQASDDATPAQRKWLDRVENYLGKQPKLLRALTAKHVQFLVLRPNEIEVKSDKVKTETLDFKQGLEPEFKGIGTIREITDEVKEEHIPQGIGTIREIRDKVQEEHIRQGAMRGMGRGSRLVKILDEYLKNANTPVDDSWTWKDYVLLILVILFVIVNIALLVGGITAIFTTPFLIFTADLTLPILYGAGSALVSLMSYGIYHHFSSKPPDYSAWNPVDHEKSILPPTTKYVKLLYTEDSKELEPIKTFQGESDEISASLLEREVVGMTERGSGDTFLCTLLPSSSFYVAPKIH